MKKFREYLAESKRNYNYIIKLAFNPDNETMNAIENALQKYSLVSITKPRSLPIQRVDKDFPGLHAPETYAFDVSIEYPVPAEFVRHTISMVGLALENVFVVQGEHDSIYFPTKQKPWDTSMNDEDEAKAAHQDKGALLDKPYDPQNNEEISGENYGTDYNDRLVKNGMGSTSQMIPKELKHKGKTLNDPEFKIGEKSAVGSTTNKKPSPKSYGPKG